MKYTVKKSDLSITSLQNNLILHRMWCEKEYKPYIDARCSVPHKAQYVFNSRFTHDTACKFGVPVDYQDVDFVSENRPKPSGKSKQGKKWEQWRHYLSNGKLSPNDFIKIVHNQLDSMPKLFMIHPSGSMTVINGRMKGTAQYSDKMRKIAIGKSQKIMNKRKYMYFLTVTYDVKGSGEDRLQAWTDYPKRLRPLNRWLRRKYNALFVRALESTKNQYPHAHYLIGTDEPIDFGGHKKITQCIGKDTEFYQEVQKYLPAPVFCLLPAWDMRAVGYVAKYVSKSQNGDLRKAKIPENKNTRKDWLKEMATICIPMVCGLRQIEYSRNIDNNPDLSEKDLESVGRKRQITQADEEYSLALRANTPSLSEYHFDIHAFVEWYLKKAEFSRVEFSRVQASFALMHKMLDEPTTPRAERAELDRLLTNWTRNCVNALQIGGGKLLAERFGDDDLYNVSYTEEDLDFIMRNTVSIGCHGCPVARFCARLQGINVNPMPDKRDIVSEQDMAKLDIRIRHQMKTEFEEEYRKLSEAPLVIMKSAVLAKSFKTKEELANFANEYVMCKYDELLKKYAKIIN